MRRPIISLLLAAAVLGASALACAAAAVGDLTVSLNESRRIPLAGVAASVVVGDPSVADVAMSDAHSVIVLGRGYGSTELTVTDPNGRTLLASVVTVVSPDRGRVTVYRGTSATEYGCGGARCHALDMPQLSSGGSGAPSPLGPPGGGEAAAAAGASNVRPASN